MSALQRLLTLDQSLSQGTNILSRFEQALGLNEQMQVAARVLSFFHFEQTGRLHQSLTFRKKSRLDHIKLESYLLPPAVPAQRRVQHLQPSPPHPTMHADAAAPGHEID